MVPKNVNILLKWMNIKTTRSASKFRRLRSWVTGKNIIFCNERNAPVEEEHEGNLSWKVPQGCSEILSQEIRNQSLEKYLLRRGMRLEKTIPQHISSLPRFYEGFVLFNIYFQCSVFIYHCWSFCYFSFGHCFGFLRLDALCIYEKAIANCIIMVIIKGRQPDQMGGPESGKHCSRWIDSVHVDISSAGMDESVQICCPDRIKARIYLFLCWSMTDLIPPVVLRTKNIL